MKQICLLVLGLLSITGIACAQRQPARSKTEKAFPMPASSIRREFGIDLGTGNRLRLALTDASLAETFFNMDSLLQVFLLDMAPLKDSFAEPLNARNVEYVTDLSGSKKIRIRQSRSGDGSFLLEGGVLSPLKTEQDTLTLSGYINNGYTRYQLTFYLNQASELAGYVDGRLNAKMREIQAKSNGPGWAPAFNNWYVLRTDTTVSVKKTGGAHFRVGSYIGPDLTVNIQNYKNHFVPSIGLGAAVRLNNGLTMHDIGVYWEPQFLFASSQVSKSLVTYRNDFITLFYKLAPANPGISPASSFFFHPFVSIGYLYHQEGGYYDPHTFRLGIGKADLIKGRATLQPVLFFHDFFRGVTPGLKLSVGFL